MKITTRPIEPREALAVLGLALLLVGCSTSTPATPASVNRVVSELHASTFLKSVPPGARIVGSIHIPPPFWNSSGHYWAGPQGITDFTYRGSTAAAFQYYSDRAVALGLRPLNEGDPANPQGWVETYPSGDFIQFELMPGISYYDHTTRAGRFELWAFGAAKQSH